VQEEKGGSSKRNKISETVHSSRNSKSPDVDIQEELVSFLRFSQMSNTVAVENSAVLFLFSLSLTRPIYIIILLCRGKLNARKNAWEKCMGHWVNGHSTLQTLVWQTSSKVP
jgi:hypothetical protein